MRKAITISILAFSIAGIIYFLWTIPARFSQKPGPPSMPAIVDESMDTLLKSLEIELEKHRPEVLSYLHPGITAENLKQAQTILNQPIHPEMQALYSWHNGQANDLELFPGYGFWSLEDAIQTNRELTRQYNEKGFGLLMGHEKNWLILFPDPAGDGYYYDPKHDYETGGVFFNFREANYYIYFPSIRNLLKAIVECYQNGAYLPDGSTNFEREDQILRKYGSAVEAQ